MVKTKRHSDGFSCVMWILSELGTVIALVCWMICHIAKWKMWDPPGVAWKHIKCWRFYCLRCFIQDGILICHKFSLDLSIRLDVCSIFVFGMKCKSLPLKFVSPHNALGWIGLRLRGQTEIQTLAKKTGAIWFLKRSSQIGAFRPLAFTANPSIKQGGGVGVELTLNKEKVFANNTVGNSFPLIWEFENGQFCDGKISPPLGFPTFHKQTHQNFSPGWKTFKSLDLLFSFSSIQSNYYYCGSSRFEWVVSGLSAGGK